MKKEECLFCKMVKGEIPCTKVYESEKVLAFEDINPCSKVHTLVIPKEHYDSLSDDVPKDILGELLHVASEVAKIKGNDSSGYRVSINTGSDGGQSVGHLHLHINGGEKLYTGKIADRFVKQK